MITIPIVQCYRIENGVPVKDVGNPENRTATIPAKVFAEWLFDQFGVDVEELKKGCAN